VVVVVAVTDGEGVCEVVKAGVPVPVAVEDADGVIGFHDSKYEAPFDEPPVTPMK
jgi:hypothetical protein